MADIDVSVTNPDESDATTITTNDQTIALIEKLFQERLDHLRTELRAEIEAVSQSIWDARFREWDKTDTLQATVDELEARVAAMEVFLTEEVAEDESPPVAAITEVMPPPPPETETPTPDTQTSARSKSILW
jgi:hypothetical protein